MINSEKLESQPGQTTRYSLVLYISDGSSSSKRAGENLEKICRQYLQSCCDVKVVNIREADLDTLEDLVLAVPMVVRKNPLPEIRIIGDLSDLEAASRLLIS